MYKNIFIVLLILVVISGCQNNKKKDDIKVGLLLDELVLERWHKDKYYITKKVNELGGEVISKVCGSDYKKQIRQADTLVNIDQVDVIIIIPSNLEKTAKIVELAHEKNVKVISYDRLIKNCDLDLLYSTDNVQIGVLMAQTMVDMCPTGNYALINGPTRDNNAFLFKLGQMSVLLPLQERGDIKIVYNEFADQWNTEEGYNQMMKCYNKTDATIDAIIGGNDALAEGIIKAIEEHDTLIDKLVSGQDADLRAIQRIIKGKQAFTIYKIIKKNATNVAEVAIKIAKGEELKKENLTTINNGYKMVPAYLEQTFVAVTKDNIEETVISDNYIKKEEICKGIPDSVLNDLCD